MKKKAETRVLSPAEHGQAFTKTIERISGHSNRRPGEVFRDALTLSLCMIERIELCRRHELGMDNVAVIPTTWLIALEPTFKVSEDECLAVQKRYDSEACAMFAECFAHLCQTARVCDAGGLSYEYTDVLGQTYEEIAVSNSGRQWFGQYFTPQSVSDMMAMLTTPEDTLDQIVRSRVHQAAQSLGLDDGVDDAETLWTRHRAQLAPCVEPVRACDPACGSGRMLLAAASVTPRWMLTAGLVYVLGVDLDPVCVQMTKINLWLRNVPGQVFHGNSLEKTICSKDATGELVPVLMDVYLANPPFGKIKR